MLFKTVPGFEFKVFIEHAPDLVSVAGVEREHRIAQNAPVLFARELTLDDGHELVAVEFENLAQQAEHEEVLAFVLRRAAECFHRRAGHGDAEIAVVFVVRIWRDVIRIIEHPAAFAAGLEVIVVAVLIEWHEPVRFIAGAQDFPAADVDLEDGRPATDGGRDGHVGHHVLLRAAGEPREESADGLNAVLRIAREPDDGVGDLVSVGGTIRRGGGGGLFKSRAAHAQDK